MPNIDEYGEIRDRNTISRFMAESIALEDARNDYRDVYLDKAAFRTLRTSNPKETGYFIPVIGYSYSRKKINILYRIDIRGSIKGKVTHDELVNSKSHNKQGCIIITACCGEISQEVQISRFFRDNYLAVSPIGRLAIDGYYKISPYIVSKIKKSKILKILTKNIIVNPIVAYEKEKITGKFTVKKILSSFIYHPCIFLITIIGLIRYFISTFMKNFTYGSS